MVNRTHVCILHVIPVAVADPRPLERVKRVPAELGAGDVQHARVAVAAAGPGVDLRRTGKIIFLDYASQVHL